MRAKARPFRPGSMPITSAVAPPSLHPEITCREPSVHFIRTSIDGSKDGRCGESPHDRFIVVVGKCRLCR
ncbi:hypothetical protein P170DRAFT_480636 [Aspergillus steynii IBT 23096]|uniref:Uncharacterized protein n=1 Tax=Aspergillus steynii IBT 23096 TaxID=1392250 RepID=A0A2I2FSU3_9EURO|nr:uncharacterized protein P170DRAFT_480636 [Aspergillus steynii IBT 23096]PLB43676.1 hypothetical protein P170DRAFT_480636 [Aspergillus steynii IBT 23096]